MHRRVLLATTLAFFLPMFGIASQAAAAAFTVTRTDDPNPDGCLPADCSLREAVMAANGEEGSTITVPAGEYTLSIPGIDDEFFDERIGDLDIRVAMTITGAGAASTIVQQTGALDRIFDNSSTTAVVIAHMTVRNGGGNARGGCIRNKGKLMTVDSVSVTSCTSSEAGGGVFTTAASLGLNTDLLILRSTIAGNSTKFGGGVAASGGEVFSTTNVKIADSVISHNSASTVGGGVGTSGGTGIHFDNAHTNVEISNTTLDGNAALSGGGGAVYVYGLFTRRTIADSTVRGNTARQGGGGIVGLGFRIDRSTFSGNRAGVGCVGAECDLSSGGAIVGYFEVNNSTFSGNACGPGQASGGAILGSTGFLRVANSTFTSNTCRVGAAVAFTGTPSPGFEATLKNTILANNTATDASGGDCAGVIASQGYNVIGNVTGCTLTPAAGDLIGADPELGPLQDNGGPTATHALSASSPARNAGNPSGCTDGNGMLLQGDQRGYARPQEGRCDIGAFEYGIDVLVVHRLRHPVIGAYLFTLYTSERDTAQREYGYVYEGTCCNWLAGAGENRAPLYRLFSSTAGEYFFTISPAERDGAVAQFGYLFEGTAAYCHPDPGTDRTAWFRLRYGNKHFFTIYPEERDSAVANLGYVYEGVACYLPVP